MGNTAILHAALKAGAIHVYPEYTGTIAFELLGMKRVPPLAGARTGCWRPTASAVGVPLGFDNSYALAMVATQAGGARHRAACPISPGIRQLRLGLSQEFLEPQGRMAGAEGGLRAAVRLRADSTTASPTRRWRPGSST